MTLGTLGWGHVGISLGAKRFKMAPGQARDAGEVGGRRHPWSVRDPVLGACRWGWGVPGHARPKESGATEIGSLGYKSAPNRFEGAAQDGASELTGAPRKTTRRWRHGFMIEPRSVFRRQNARSVPNVGVKPTPKRKLGIRETVERFGVRLERHVRYHGGFGLSTEYSPTSQLNASHGFWEDSGISPGWLNNNFWQ